MEVWKRRTKFEEGHSLVRNQILKNLRVGLAVLRQIAEHVKLHILQSCVSDSSACFLHHLALIKPLALPKIEMTQGG